MGATECTARQIILKQLEKKWILHIVMQTHVQMYVSRTRVTNLLKLERYLMVHSLTKGYHLTPLS